MDLKEQISKIVEYCDRKIMEERRIMMIIDNPFVDEFDWAFRFRYIYINISESRLPDPALVYDSVEKSLKIYERGEYYKIESYLKSRKIEID
ncbi:MAG: hypothetical protein NZ908_01940 [Candidatus Micrarchaeota archaeon]|nr:hypothetical protein [Candidatus Micrarchaeota archaeon]MCX8154527.1 hypothetical protein [Candidatus Micrarchaeota archaeon]